MNITIPEDVFDVIIIGGGPGGLTAGLYASRAGMKTLLLEGNVTVSQITVTDIVENYPGVPNISGPELIGRLKEHSSSFGMEIKPEQVLSIRECKIGDIAGWKVQSDKGEYRALAVIVSTGAVWRKLGVPGELEFAGRGVSYCATCDGPFYRNSEVIVVGGGDTAVQEALFLTKFASKVTIVHRRDRLRATAILQKRAFAQDKIEFAWDSVVVEVLGETAVTGARIRSVKEPKETREIPADGVFIFIGLDPVSDVVRDLVKIDSYGYVIVGREMSTSTPGIFACGDCIQKPFRQIINACGEGATAAYHVELYIDELKGQSY
ncbi:MAG: thioredoxin-disulfide reductase [Deltaproteobacteria bacterium]|nr:thioredoxin-disulfide reductase [Deltaproteobacteria bacterium]